MNFEEALAQMGFSPIESTIFCTLCKHGALTGYEVAKLTNLSRSNVYAALYALQEKGRCYLAEGESTKYVALSKEELLATYQHTVSQVHTAIHTLFPTAIVPSEPYITIRGTENVRQKVTSCIAACQSHLYLLASPYDIQCFLPNLEALGESRKLTIICNEPIALTHATVHKRLKQPEGFHMIIDTQVVLTGEMHPTSSQCLYTTNQSLVRFMRESFITELDMIKTTYSGGK